MNEKPKRRSALTPLGWLLFVVLLAAFTYAVGQVGGWLLWPPEWRMHQVIPDPMPAPEGVHWYCDEEGCRKVEGRWPNESMKSLQQRLEAEQRPSDRPGQAD